MDLLTGGLKAVRDFLDVCGYLGTSVSSSLPLSSERRNSHIFIIHAKCSATKTLYSLPLSHRSQLLNAVISTLWGSWSSGLSRQSRRSNGGGSTRFMRLNVFLLLCGRFVLLSDLSTFVCQPRDHQGKRERSQGHFSLVLSALLRRVALVPAWF